MENMIDKNVAEIVEQAEVLVPDMVMDTVVKEPSVLVKALKSAGKNAGWIGLGMGLAFGVKKLAPKAGKLARKLFHKQSKYIETEAADAEKDCDAWQHPVDDLEKEYPVE